MPPSKVIKLALAGATGRMGREVLALVIQDQRFEIVEALVAPASQESGSSFTIDKRTVPINDQLRQPCDVLVDFTVAAGTMTWLETCVAKRIAMVIGATGHSEAQLEAIRAAARDIPIVKASNFSVGVHVVLELAGRLASMLGREYDVEIVEAHHRHKIDAPSGTARSLVERIVAASSGHRGRLVHGRQGHVGQRSPEEIGIHAVRMGEIIGQHEIHFSGPGETITLRHSAQSRATYAAGALHAAAWVVNRAPGLYGMEDIMRV